MSSLYRTATSPAASMAAYSSHEQQQQQQEPRPASSAVLLGTDLQLNHGAPLLPSPTPLSCSSSSRALAGGSPDDASGSSSKAFASPFMADAADSRVVDESTRLWVSSRSPPRTAGRVVPGRGAGTRQALDFQDGGFKLWTRLPHCHPPVARPVWLRGLTEGPQAWWT